MDRASLSTERRQLESQISDLRLVLNGQEDAELSPQLAAAETRMAEIDSELAKPLIAPPFIRQAPKADSTGAFAAWLRLGTPVEQRGDQASVGRAGANPGLMTIRSGNGLTSNAAPGSNLVPKAFHKELFSEIELNCNVLSFAHVIHTDGGNPLELPIDDDTLTNEGHWLTQLAPDDILDPEPKTTTFSGYAATSHAILASWSLLQDSPLAENLFLTQAGTRIGKALEKAYINGDGVNKPTGIFTGAGTTGLPVHTSAASGKIETDDLLAAMAKVDPAVLSGPKVRMLCNPQDLYKLRSLKDGQGRYLISDPVSGFFPTVLGIQVVSSLHVPAGQIAIANFDGYWIRMAREIEFIKLIEKYAMQRATAFFSWCRTDAKWVSTRSGIIVKAKP